MRRSISQADNCESQEARRTRSRLNVGRAVEPACLMRFDCCLPLRLALLEPLASFADPALVKVTFGLTAGAERRFFDALRFKNPCGVVNFDQKRASPRLCHSALLNALPGLIQPCAPLSQYRKRWLRYQLAKCASWPKVYSIALARRSHRHLCCIRWQGRRRRRRRRRCLVKIRRRLLVAAENKIGRERM
eukprot:4869295-Pleurochrysis_carterae.AAC.6